ncbi:MAG: hypothetical protein CR997_00380 [Acidobacteria bacterium]|nr:MAG: hypothetical protein CR997_00380 [Acidobacteriota bacterium]
MTINWSGLAPHPPIIVPEIGGRRGSEASLTIESMRQFSSAFMACHCDLLIVLSPHTPRPRCGIATWTEPTIHGDFAAFGHPDLKYQFENDPHWVHSFSKTYQDIHRLSGQSLDHGALVPLHFLAEAGWQGKTVVLGLPWDESEHQSIANAISEACRSSQRTGLLASGDMSHCLKHGAPAGFHPMGQEFDSLFIAHIKRGEYKKALHATGNSRSKACEDVIGSCDIAWRVTDYNHHHFEFHSYEGPFGVGYCVSTFHRD